MSNQEKPAFSAETFAMLVQRLNTFELISVKDVENYALSCRSEAAAVVKHLADAIANSGSEQLDLIIWNSLTALLLKSKTMAMEIRPYLMDSLLLNLSQYSPETVSELYSLKLSWQSVYPE